MNLYEKTIASTEVFCGRIVNLKVDTVVLPNGKTSKRELVEHADAVAILPIINDKVIFVRQYRKAIERVILEIPAGLLEKNESPNQAAARELQEEIGYYPLNLKKIGDVWPSAGFCDEKTTLFIATKAIYAPKKMDDDEFLEVVSIPLRTVKALFMRGMFRDAKTYNALGYYFSLNK